jgi:hypothetical protein
MASLAKDEGQQDEMEIDDVGPLASSTTSGTRPISRAAPCFPNGGGHIILRGCLWVRGGQALHASPVKCVVRTLTENCRCMR